MKRTSAELKRIARENLQGHYGLPIGTMVVANLITGAILLPFSLVYELNQSTANMIIYQIANVIISLLSTILSSGLIRIHLKLARGEQPFFSDLFYCFTRRPDRFILGTLLIVVITFLCLIPGGICLILYGFTSSAALGILGLLLTLVAIVLVVIIEFHFALAYTLLTEHDSMGVMEAFSTSHRLMKGNKGRLFYIELTFIGWSLLALLTCGLGYLWLSPYMSQTFVEFYRDVIGELDKTPEDTEFHSEEENFYSEESNSYSEEQDTYQTYE